jgi:uncharacterized repeat protein (TIGR02543 family)
MVTLSNANNALKTFYLGVLANQLNVGVNPLLAKIEHTSSDVWGKEIKKLAPYGINGGIGSGRETDSLPQVGGNNYAEFTLGLKNLYGQIELSDKAIRASQNSVGAFVNLLNAEMEGLLGASKFNFGRMLYGDGTGMLTYVTSSTSGNVIEVESIKCLMEGMTIDIYNPDGTKNVEMSGSRIDSIDRNYKSIYLSKYTSNTIEEGSTIYVQGSKDNELTGLEAVFGEDDIYGLCRGDFSFLTPHVSYQEGGVSVSAIQDAIDTIEQNAGSSIDFITCSYDVRKSYVEAMASTRTNVDYMTIDGGYKALSFAGIPVVADRFIHDGTMYLLNSGDFKLHQLCDWRWLEGEGGTVLHQVPGKPAYTATLVKYADLLCERPMGQAKIVFDKAVTPAYYNVMFNSNGGTLVNEQIVRPGSKAVQPAAPTKTGKVFDGWYLDGSKYTFKEAVNEDIMLVAEWT